MVRLLVRYQTAQDFVEHYAENLSRRGVFIRDAQGLEPGQEVNITIGLPDERSFDVVAVVAHVITPERAAALGRAAGAGFAITMSPPGFEEALYAYLMRLGRRAEATVVTREQECRGFLEAAGYRVELLGSPAELARLLAGANGRTVAAVGRADVDAYLAWTAAGGSGGAIVAWDPGDDLDALLARIDGIKLDGRGL